MLSIKFLRDKSAEKQAMSRRLPPLNAICAFGIAARTVHLDRNLF
jgi:hypothetical protein